MSCITKVLRVQPSIGYCAPLPPPLQPADSKDSGLKKALECDS